LDKKYINILKIIAKLLLTALALWWVFQTIDIKEVLALIAECNFFLLSLALVLYALSKALAAYRLNIFFRSIDLKLSQSQNLKLNWLGMYYNIFLPGGVGGDGYKIYVLGKYSSIRTKAIFQAVLADRISGITALFILAVVLFSYIPQIIPFQKFSWIITFVIFFFFWLLNRLVFKNFVKLTAISTIYSIGVQFLQLISVVLIISSFGSTDNLFTYLFIFLLSSVITIIPITIGGVGAREITFLYGTQWFGLIPELSVSISFLFYLVSVLASLPGIYYAVKPITSILPASYD
jgi:hypothetical protein